MSAEDYLETATVFDFDTPLSKALYVMTQASDGHVVVTREGQYHGIVDDRSLRDFYGDPERTKLGNIAVQVPVVLRSTSDEDIIANFLNIPSKVIAVVDKGKIVGVVSRLSAMRILFDSPATSGKRVSEFMTKPAAVILQTATISQARKMMKDRKIYKLVVVDEKNRVVGLLSSYDLAIKITAKTSRDRRQATFRPTEQLRAESDQVSAIMSPNVITTSPDSTLKEAVGKMLQNKILGLVVTRADKPLGMITAKDIASSALVAPILPIELVGLDSQDRLFKQALIDEANAFWEKWRKRLDFQREDRLQLTIKGNREGNKKRYEIKARITLGGRVITAREPNIDPHRQTWDLHMAVKEALSELEKELDKQDKKPRAFKQRFQQHRVREGG